MPTLFILYVNDLFSYKGIDNVSLIMYADDTVIYNSNSDPSVVLNTVQTAMNNIVEWCELDKLTINENKTKFTTFLRKPSTHKYVILCKSTSLERTPNYRYLGIDIDLKIYTTKMFVLKLISSCICLVKYRYI